MVLESALALGQNGTSYMSGEAKKKRERGKLIYHTKGSRSSSSVRLNSQKILGSMSGLGLLFAFIQIT